MRAPRLLHLAWALTRDSVIEFFNDNALSRGAALAYYTAFALAPVLLIAISVAGLAFGREAAQGAVVQELSGVMGEESAQALQTLLTGAFFHRGSGWLATAFGVVTLLITATGVFVELQSSLNAIWKAEPAAFTTSEIVRARLLSLGILAALAFMLIVSLLFSTALHAAGAYFTVVSAHLQTVLIAGNVVVSFVLLTLLFAAIYKVLPDRIIAWRDVGVGAFVTAALFSIGKFAISFYIGSSAIASSYGPAGSLIVLLVWIYYSTQIFFLGAEFTKVYAQSRGRMPGR
ncbi:MAG TPA: YihY/virulence factor BrkB family protein [Acetobacteraceae bacterium]|nr:YihY/virulence factor BrkB family protein [Acetobacteraceae bacterium]